jgi:hypothetical protein
LVVQPSLRKSIAFTTAGGKNFAYVFVFCHLGAFFGGRGASLHVEDRGASGPETVHCLVLADALTVGPFT